MSDIITPREEKIVIDRGGDGKMRYRERGKQLFEL